MARRKDTNTILMPGMADYITEPEKKVKGQRYEAKIAAPEFGGKDFGKYRGPVGAQTMMNMGETGLETGETGPITKALIVDDSPLRDYQEMCAKSLLWAISRKNPEAVNAVASIMATGTGKTYTICKGVIVPVAVKYKRKVLVVVNQDELINQWLECLEERCGIIALREQAGYDFTRGLGQVDTVVVVASEQSLRGERLRRIAPDFFDLVIHDECDLSLAPKWTELFEWLVGARHIGITATPKRLDGAYITERFTVVPKDAQYYITQAVKEGWLVRPIMQQAQHETIDLSKLRVTAGDINLKDLDAVIRDSLSGMVEASIPLMEGRPTIVYTPTVFTAQLAAEFYEQAGLRTDFISAKTDAKSEIFKRARAGEIDVLCNCALVTRGVDLPIMENVVLARPTASTALFTQMVGRVMRPYFETDENGNVTYTKTVCRIINFAWKFEKKRHTLADPIDLYDTRDKDEKVIKMAKQMVRDKLEADPDAIIEAEEIMEMAEQRIREEIKRNVKYQAKNIKAQITVLDPLVLDILKVPQRPATNWMEAKEATNAQKELLRKWKYDPDRIENLTMQKASRLIEEAKRRREANLCTWPQAKTLIRCGVDMDVAREMSFQEAVQQLNILLPQQPWYKAR
jgi:superfamily II DNA or RNA helicase